MRKALVILAVILWLTVPLSAEAASPWPSPPGQDKGGDTTNIATGGTGIGIGVGIAGAKADATAVNMNYISTRNELSLKNFTSQNQGQLQGQKQSIDAPLTNTTAISIVNPENKRELPGIPTGQVAGQLEYRGPYEKGIQHRATPWRFWGTWSEDTIAGFYSMSDSASCKSFVLKKKEASTGFKMGAEQGSPAAILECTADSGNELWGTAGKKALELGAAYVNEMVYSVTYANKSFGWNIGLGGGVTAVNGGDDSRGGAVGGGTGIGSVETRPVEKVHAIFSIY